ncbi:MAG: isoprenyl transferase [Candidatus Kapaibacteriota bacterium]|jgi:undecaprenyl diphosphate synthase
MNWYTEQSETDLSSQNEILKSYKLPKHIGIIMDGNGRWAIEHGLSRTEGHKQGIESVRDIVKACAQLGVPFLTLYAFSLENWKRPSSEVGVLMNLLEYYLKKEIKELNANNVRLLAIGKISSLPKKVQRLLFDSIEITSKNTGLTLTLALSYSGRWDIVRAVQMIAHDIRRGKIAPEDITEEIFSNYLQTSQLPDPDLIIRTSGELRLSNFLLWESAYSEIYISSKYWPEFRRQDLYEAIRDYSRRERRFGKISAQVRENEILNVVKADTVK